MADPKTNPEPPAAEPTPEEAENAFWAKHEEKTLGLLDKWFDKKREEFQGISTSRGDGRATLPGIIANIMFGPAKNKS